MAAPCWRLVAGGAELRVRAQPNASRDQIEGLGEDTAVEQLIAKTLGLPKSAVSVEKGETQRIKTVRISADPSIGAAIEALLARP
jgi:uncharacterized protein YggU (UPF0235/DUF167 family)